MLHQIDVEVLGTEVVQSIQDLEGNVELIAGKRTVIRVYLLPKNLDRSLLVKGVLKVKRKSSKKKWKYINSESAIEIRPAPTLRSDKQRRDYLDAMRRSLEHSFLFVLEEKHTRLESKSGGNRDSVIEFALDRLCPVIGNGHDIHVDTPIQEAKFCPGPNLRLHLVGLGIRDLETEERHLPSTSSKDTLFSFVNRAFPVCHLDGTTTDIDASPEIVPPFESGRSNLASPSVRWQRLFDAACAQVMAIRGRDVDMGVDPRTHYYALIDYPDEFFVGGVSDVPASPRPDVVGVGPAEVEDGTYGAHELGHALGLLHPGCCEGQQQEDQNIPEGYGCHLSSGELRHFGFDVGDWAQRPRPLPFDDYHDLMSYCERLWVSEYNYRNLWRRLNAENALPWHPVHGDFLHVVGTYDMIGGGKKGAIKYAFPVEHEIIDSNRYFGKSKNQSGAHENRVVLVTKLENGDPALNPIVIKPKRSEATDMQRDSGAFQLTLPGDSGIARIELWVGGIMVDAVSDDPATGDHQHALHPRCVRISPPTTSREDPYVVSIEWPRDYDPQVKHCVFARICDDSDRWTAIAVDLTSNSSNVLLDKDRFALPQPLAEHAPSSDEDSIRTVLVHSKVEVRILRSNGLSECEIFHGQPPIEYRLRISTIATTATASPELRDVLESGLA